MTIYIENQSKVDYKLRYQTTKFMFLTYILCSCAVKHTFSAYVCCFQMQLNVRMIMSSEYASDVNEKVTHAGFLRVNFDLLRKLEII
jgi:hypothetical protein